MQARFHCGILMVDMHGESCGGKGLIVVRGRHVVGRQHGISGIVWGVLSGLGF